VLALGASLVLLMAVIGVAAYLRAESGHDNCERINSDRAILSRILRRSETLSLEHPQPDFKEAEIRAYYRKALDELAPANC
jgi:hypothetical protein